jgi:hypothetical protein
MTEMRHIFRLLLRNLEGRHRLKYLALDKRIILKWILREWGCTADSVDAGWGPMVG